MPKIKITEKDNTGNLQLNPITNVVYIPGAASKKTAPLFCGGVSDLDGFKATEGLVDDLSFKLARRLLQLGMQVLYQGFTLPSSSTVEWKDGKYTSAIVEKPIQQSEDTELTFNVSGVEFVIIDNGTKIKTKEKYGPEGSQDYIQVGVVNGIAEVQNAYLFDNNKQKIKLDFVDNMVEYDKFGFSNSESLDIKNTDWQALADKSLYDIRFITSGAYPGSASQEMVKCATKRGDCVALIDHGNSLNDEAVASIRNYFEQFVGEDDEASTMKGKFAAGFTPWFKSESDAFGGTKVSPVEIPASFGYLLAYARSIQSNPDWFAVAGTFRGNIPELSDVCREFTSAEVEILQARADDGEVALDESGDNIGFAINPIAYVRGYGYLVWGNRTLIENEDSNGDGSGDLKASAFLNVRNICIDIVKTLYAAARKYTFEQNSDVLWLNFRHEVQPLLDRMVSGNGIETYTMERLATPKKARLKARIAIVPIEGVEDFELELYLEDSLEVIE